MLSGLYTGLFVPIHLPLIVFIMGRVYANVYRPAETKEILYSEHNMKQVLDISTGEVKAGMGETVLRSTAIGSCVVVAAYNFISKTGAMAHIMLPGTAPENYIDKTKYAANAIEKLINMITSEDSKPCDIEACLVGAGNVLKKEDDTICNANIKSTTQILKEKHIALRASVLGGTKRKSVFMDIEEGSISFTEGNEKEKVLWKAEP